MSKFVGGARIQKELQGFAAFVAYQECHYKGLSTSKDSIEHSMEQQFFGVKGDADFIGLSEQLVKGIGVFGGLYTLEGIATLDASNFANTPTRHDDSVLVLKPELHCLGHHVHVGDNDSSNEKHMQSIRATLQPVAGITQERCRMYLWDPQGSVEDSKDGYSLSQY